MGRFIFLCFLFFTSLSLAQGEQITLPEAGLVRLGGRRGVPGIQSRWKGALEEGDLPSKSGRALCRQKPRHAVSASGRFMEVQRAKILFGSASHPTYGRNLVNYF